MIRQSSADSRLSRRSRESAGSDRSQRSNQSASRSERKIAKKKSEETREQAKKRRDKHSRGIASEQGKKPHKVTPSDAAAASRENDHHVVRRVGLQEYTTPAQLDMEGQHQSDKSQSQSSSRLPLSSPRKHTAEYVDSEIQLTSSVGSDGGVARLGAQVASHRRAQSRVVEDHDWDRQLQVSDNTQSSPTAARISTRAAPQPVVAETASEGIGANEGTANISDIDKRIQALQAFLDDARFAILLLRLMVITTNCNLMLCIGVVFSSTNALQRSPSNRNTSSNYCKRNVVTVMTESKMVCDEEQYIASFNPGLIEVAHAWAAGAKFVEVCKLTDIFEGSIIRSLRRLEELLRQLASASLAIGNKELKVKFEEGADKIRRGVVFAASLYL